MSSWLLLLIAAVLVALNGFFVACEFALIKVRATRLEELAKQGSGAARVSREMLRELNTYLSASQVGTTLVSIALGWIAEPAFHDLLAPLLKVANLPEQLGSALSFVIAFSTVTFFHVVFGEQVPKVYAISNPERTMLCLVLPFRLFYYLFYPVIWVLTVSADKTLRLLRVPQLGEHEVAHSEEELRMLLSASAQHGILKDSEVSLVENVFQFANKDARDVMVPRVDMVYLSTEWTLERNLQIVHSHTFTRFPLCEGDPDSVIGMVHVKDLLRFEKELESRGLDNADLREIVRPVLFVPESRSIDTLLREFQVRKMHMAIVLDEYGGTAGLATLEDVIEEIVGEIHDEFEEPLPEVQALSANRFLIDGKTPLDDLRADHKLDLPAERADTIGGWMLDRLGSIPARGAVVETDRYRVEVTAMDGQRVRQVTLSIKEPAPHHPVSTGPRAPAGPEDDPVTLLGFEPTDATPRQFRRWRRGLGRLERDYVRWSQDSRVAALPCLRQKYLYAVLHPRRYYGKEQLVSHWLGVDSGEIRKQCEQCDKWRSLYAAMKDEKGNRRGLFSFLSRAAGLIIGLS